MRRLLIATLIALAAAAPAGAVEVNGSTKIDPNRFGGKAPDSAFGAFQRGLYITALNIALPRAKEGDASAMTLVAEIYARGLGVPRNPAEASRWYGEAAALAVPEAQFQYALILLDGEKTPETLGRARTLLQAAADTGHRIAQFNFAQFVIDRDRGDAGMKLAVDYYERAANAGLADAQYAISQILANGGGGRARDETAARKWMGLAARQNFDTAQVDYGTWLVEGRGGPRDMKAGFGWIKQAAEGGNVAAQSRLAKLYVGGLGVEPSVIEGAAWYIIARRAGLSDAYMDDVMGGLTDDEKKFAIERANRLR